MGDNFSQNSSVTVLARDSGEVGDDVAVDCEP
jgi:hypothetical protein